MSYETLLYEVADHVATITFNRAEKMNTWNGTVASELSDAMQTANTDNAVRHADGGYTRISLAPASPFSNAPSQLTSSNLPTSGWNTAATRLPAGQRLAKKTPGATRATYILMRSISR